MCHQVAHETPQECPSKICRVPFLTSQAQSGFFLHHFSEINYFLEINYSLMVDYREQGVCGQIQNQKLAKSEGKAPTHSVRPDECVGKGEIGHPFEH